jgi:Mn-dependent DtxR family transcriptional regulator
LKKTAIVLMVLFRLDKPVGEGELAEILDVYPTTVRTYLRSLAHLGMVTRTHRYHGWMLTAGGRQMVLGESTHQCLEEHVIDIHINMLR